MWLFRFLKSKIQTGMGLKYIDLIYVFEKIMIQN